MTTTPTNASATRQPRIFTRALGLLAAALVVWVLIFWRLDLPHLLDPDEAHYAQISREMLEAGEWFVPLLDGSPFLDKPVLFHWLQAASFGVFGYSELGARLPTALAALAVLALTWWMGRRLFGAEIGLRAALMLATTPIVFKFARVAILDMVFTAFLFGAVALVASAAVRGPARLQYPGYLLLGLAVLTKGPVALLLAGLAFLLALAMSREARQALLRLHWIAGTIAAVLIPLPWFVYLWIRFGEGFIEHYLLYGNIWLYATPLYREGWYPFFYLRILFTAFLPWSLLLVGACLDAARQARPRAASDPAAILLCAWVLVVFGFFTFSRFKLDHYVLPAAPALCLLASRAWQQARRPSASAHAAVTQWTILGVALVLMAGGILIAGILPVAMPEFRPTALLFPAGLATAGVILALQMARRGGRPPRLAAGSIAALLVSMASVLTIGLPMLERTRPAPELARWIARTAGPDDRVAIYRLDRWRASLRFYAGRPLTHVENPEQLRALLANRPPVYLIMQTADLEFLRARGFPLTVLHVKEGIVGTTGRGLRRRQRWSEIVIASPRGEQQGEAVADLWTPPS
jgi:4-amino-4-deoxy-L-arabinose transferase-like glycosyltransferase